MSHRPSLLGMVSLCLTALLPAAESPTVGKNLLGTADAKASPEHPLGWRGDGAGRYMGATPTARFERIATTPISSFRCQVSSGR